MPQCAAFNCKNAGTHGFPKDPIRRKQWELAIQRKASKSARLCPSHFKPDDYDYWERKSKIGDTKLQKKLRDSAVPTKCLFSNVVRKKSDLRLKKEDESLVDEPQPSQPEKSSRKCKENDKNLVKLEKLPGLLQANINKPSILRKRLHKDVIVKKEDPDESAHSEEDKPMNIPADEGTLADNDNFADDNNFADDDILADPDQQPEIKHSQISAKSKSTQANFLFVYGSIENHLDKDSAIAFYTGFESYVRFRFVFLTLSPMTHHIKYVKDNITQNLTFENQFFLTMMKLRQNKSNFELSLFFQTTPLVVSEIFSTWINFMDRLWQKLNIWTDKDTLLYYMLDCFKHPDVKSISKQQMNEEDDLYSSCKTKDSIIDAVNAEKKNVSLNISKFFNGKGPKTVGYRNIACQQAHIDSLLGLSKSYKILKEDLHNTLVPYASKIFFVCLMCCNFRNSLLDLSN